MSAVSAALPRATEVRPKISLRDIRVDFTSPEGEPVNVLQHIDLEVPPGQFVSIVGPSGCGKSTLLRLVSGLVAPSSGEVLIDGEAVARTPERVGFMFQRDTLLPWATVEENIKLGAELAHAAPAAIPGIVARLIALLRLGGFEKHRPHQLSGGMRQRVALGRVLAYEPDIFLMDEPFGALDAQTKAVMGQELLRVWSANQRSVIFVTHDIEEAVALSDRVIVLSARPGRIKLDLEIDIDRPRIPSLLRKAPRFAELTELLWQSLDLGEV